jgi:hypothetical protein
MAVKLSSLTRQPCSATQEYFLVLISLRGWLNNRAIEGMEILEKLKDYYYYYFRGL